MRRVERLLRWPAAPVAVALVPLVVAVSRALARGWLPMGDNAYFAIRARDVMTEHHPLLGAWSSGSDAVGVDVNNLGPLQLDLLAPFVRLLGFGPGTAIGVASVNAAAVVVVVVFARRRLGAVGAWLGAAMATALAWTLGSELLFEPRQHHALVLPFLAFLVGVWSLVRGDRRALPVTALLASLLAQTHLTFAQPTLLLSVVGALAAAAVTRERVVEGGADSGDGGWRSWRGSVLVTVMVLVVCWIQPLAEELQSGPGNLSAVREAASAGSSTFGLERAVRAVSSVIVPPDGWWRPSFRAFDPEGRMMSAGAATAALAALAVAALVTVWLTARRGERVAAAWVATALGAIAVCVATAAGSPTSGPFGAVSGNFRFLWPVGVFTAFGFVATVVRLAGRRFEVLAMALLAGVTVAFVAAGAPTSYQSPGPEDDGPLIPVARSLRHQVLDHDLAGPVAVDRSGLFFGEPYTYVVLAALQESGVDIVLVAPTDLSRFGDGRRRDGPVEGTVTFVGGLAALDDVPGSQLLARASLDDDQARGDRGTVAVWFTPSG